MSEIKEGIKHFFSKENIKKIKEGIKHFFDEGNNSIPDTVPSIAKYISKDSRYGTQEEIESILREGQEGLNKTVGKKVSTITKSEQMETKGKDREQRPKIVKNNRSDREER